MRPGVHSPVTASTMIVSEVGPRSTEASDEAPTTTLLQPESDAASASARAVVVWLIAIERGQRSEYSNDPVTTLDEPTQYSEKVTMRVSGLEPS